MHLSKLAASAAMAAFAATIVPAPASAAGSAPQPSICNRPCWAARAPQCTISYNSALNRAIVHHTASSGQWNTTSLSTSASYVRGTQNYHMDSNGWCDIGYNFLFDKLGNIFEGRHASLTSYTRGAHDGANTNSMGFSILGYCHTPYNNAPTAALLDSLYDCIAWRMPSGWGPYGYPNCSYGGLGLCVGYVDGHRRVSSTACPGDLMFNNYMGTNMNAGAIRNEINARINASTLPTYTIDNASGGFSSSANWSTGTSAGDKYGADYRFRSTAAVSDPANFSASVTAGTYKVSAWWTAGTNRAPSASYVMPDGSTVAVNQQINGGAFRLLATKSLSGTATTKLSCWTTTGYVVVADAVRYAP